MDLYLCIGVGLTQIWLYCVSLMTVHDMDDGGLQKTAVDTAKAYVVKLRSVSMNISHNGLLILP